MFPEDYSRHLVKVGVAQMLQTVGFQSVQSTALDILVEVMERYIFLVSKSSHDYAEFGNLNFKTTHHVPFSIAQQDTIHYYSLFFIFKN